MLFSRCVLIAIFALITCFYVADFAPQAQALDVKKIEEEGEEIIEEEKMDEDDERFEQRIKNAISNMGQSNHNQVEQGIYFFEKMGDEAVPHLEKALIALEDERRERNNILYALGRLGDEAKLAVPSMIKYLQHDDEETRVITIIALGKIGKNARKASQPISFLLNDQSQWVRDKAYEALQKIGGPVAETAVSEYNREHGIKN